MTGHEILLIGAFWLFILWVCGMLASPLVCRSRFVSKVLTTAPLSCGLCLMAGVCLVLPAPATPARIVVFALLGTGLSVPAAVLTWFLLQKLRSDRPTSRTTGSLRPELNALRSPIAPETASDA